MIGRKTESANKIQKIKFNSIDEFFENITDEERTIAEILRKVIFDCIPDCIEKLSYNVPYYYRHSRICFIWPASIPWGALDNGVAIGFCKGDKIFSDMNYLEREGRKKVCRKIFTEAQDIEVELLKAHLYEAVIADERGK